MLRREGETAPTVPLENVARLSDALLALLEAFDLVCHAEGQVAFQDATVLKVASGLEDEGQDHAAIVRALLDRRAAPRGRHHVGLGADGRAVLIWQDGVTEMDGQGMLALDEGDRVDDLFEQALDAEALGDLNAAQKLFETCAQMNRLDALASFNLGNIRRELGDYDGAVMAFRQAVARDPGLAEASYNLAGVLERQGDIPAAKSALQAAIAADSSFAEALFNLAQLELSAENWLEAKVLFERFLATGFSGPLVGKAEKALRLVSLARELRNSRPG